MKSSNRQKKIPRKEVRMGRVRTKLAKIEPTIPWVGNIPVFGVEIIDQSNCCLVGVKYSCICIIASLSGGLGGGVTGRIMAIIFIRQYV